MTFVFYIAFIIFMILLINRHFVCTGIKMENSDKKPPVISSKPIKYLVPHNRKPNRDETETTFLWHIKNFEMCPDQWGKPLKSPEFCIYNWQSPKFYLMLYPGGVNEKSSKYLSAYLVKTSFEEENITYSCKLGIITKKDKKTCLEFSNSKLTRGQGKGLAEFFRRELLQSSENDIFLSDGILTIFCEINVTKLNELSDGTRSQLKDLSDMYAIIYNSEKYCDVYLHVGEKTFKVHKAILEVRFPDLLKNMAGNTCKVEGIGLKTINSLLRYLYTGFLNTDELNLFEILSSSYVLPSHLKCLLLEKQNKIEATTCLQKTVLSFSWKIQNFSSLDSSKIIHYPLVGDYTIKWTWLDLFVSVTTDEADEEKDEESDKESDEESDDDYVSISIQRFSKDCKTIICTIKISDVSKTFAHTYNKEDKWTLPNFLSKAMLKDKISDANLDEINLDFEMAVSDGKQTIEFGKKELTLNSNAMNQTAEDLKTFQKDLINILNTPKYCDMTLISGKEKIPAHKFIISARSSIFCDMLESEPTKKKNSEIIISDLDSSVIKDMLAYMYSNECKFSLPGMTHVHNLYIAANKYFLTGLKDKCVNFLKSSLNPETAGDILTSAHKWNDNELKELVYNFVCTCPLQIATSKEWEQVMLKNSDLASEVLKKTLFYLAAKNKIINIETD